VLQMVMDSLRYWAQSYRVDGFRFDLGVTLGREGTGFDQGSGFFDAILQDPVLSRLKLISEPWDLGPDGYQLGQHPPGFAEWNDKFRDGVRRFWRGDSGARGELAGRLMGSPEIFDRRHRRPWSSINFIASHDGFTTRDVVSYNEKHNDANNEDNRDGHNENLSRNWGVEGLTDDPAILALRAQTQRALLATNFFSLGTPMLLAGDEFGRSQEGNNNAYCQDNELSWLNWKEAGEPEGQSLTDFVGRIAALRHAHPSLRISRFLDASRELAPGVVAVGWYDIDGQFMTGGAWDDQEGKVLGLRRACEIGDTEAVEVTLLLINGGDDEVTFNLPEPAMQWRQLVASAKPDLHEQTITAPHIVIAAHSIVLLGAQVQGTPP
jgi:isoamylase